MDSYGYLMRHGMFAGSFIQFVSSNHVLANNYLTRILSGKWGGVEELTESDLLKAVDVIKQKFLIVRFADHRKIIEYLIQNKEWSENAQVSLDCMYPPTSDWGSNPKPEPPSPPKTEEEIAETLEYGVIKMNVDTDTQYAFSRPIVDHIFSNYDGMLKVDGEVGNKKAYDPRAYLKAGETGMKERVKEAIRNLNGENTSISAK